MGIVPGGQHSDPGCVFHWAAQEMREQFDKFIDEQVVPNAPEVGLPADEDVR